MKNPVNNAKGFVNNIKGFTLIELLMVIAIAGILVTIAIPSYQDTIRQNQMAAATNDLVRIISFARLEALKTGNSVTVSTTNSDTDWSAGLEVVSADNGTIRKLEPTDSDVSIKSSTVSSLTFNANGFVANAGDSFTICQYGSTDGRQIAVAISGRINIDTDYTCK